MKKPRVLVSAIGGDIGRGASELLHNHDFTVIGCDVQECRFPTKLLEAFYQVPHADEGKQYRDRILSIIKREKVDFFLPISEPELLRINAMRTDFDKCHARILINNEQILSLFLDKYKTARYLDSLGICIPNTQLLADGVQPAKYPIIVKARSGCGGGQVWRVDNESELERLRLIDEGHLIIQEHIGSPDAEYTTGVFADGESVSTISFRRTLGYGGLTRIVELEDHEDLDRLATTVAEATDLVGSINIQSRREGNIFYPFEINPRLSSTLVFRERFGFDDIKWWIDATAGNKHSYERLYKSGRGVRVLKEEYYDLIEV